MVLNKAQSNPRLVRDQRNVALFWSSACRVIGPRLFQSMSLKYPIHASRSSQSERCLTVLLISSENAFMWYIRRWIVDIYSTKTQLFRELYFFLEYFQTYMYHIPRYFSIGTLSMDVLKWMDYHCRMCTYQVSGAKWAHRLYVECTLGASRAFLKKYSEA